MDCCCICHPSLKPNAALCPRHKEQAILTAIETNIRISEAADTMYWDAREVYMSLIHCCCCGEAKGHFTTVDDMGGYCDECVIAGKLKAFGITMPAVPGIVQKSRESIVPEFAAHRSSPPTEL